MNPSLALIALAAAITGCASSSPGGSAPGSAPTASPPRQDSVAPAPAWALTGTLIVLNKGEDSASLLDCATGAELARLPTGRGPHEVAISPDGRTAVVADYGVRGALGQTLTVIDVPAMDVSRTIDLGSYHRPHGIQFLPDGARVIVTTEQEQAVIVVDVEAGEVTAVYPTGQRVSHMVVLTPDGRRAFAANIVSGNVTVIDLAASEPIAQIETGRGAEGIDISPDGREVWVGNRADDTVSVIDTTSLEVVDSLPCASFPIRVKFTPDGRHVLVSNAQTGDVAVFDARGRQEVRRIPMQEQSIEEPDERLFGDSFGESPVPVGIVVEPRGRRAFVANTNADVVTVIDLETWKITGRLTAGREPDGLGYSPIVLDRVAR